jgi:hypothetical protein
MDQFINKLLAEVRKAAVASGPSIKSLDRTYGVEFELCFNGSKFMEYIKTKLGKNDHEAHQIKRWFQNGYQEECNQILAQLGLEGWDCHGDGSVRVNDYEDIGTEIVSPVLSGTEGLRKIAAFLEFAKASGGYVNRSCGGHVHVGAADLLQGNQKQVANRIILGMLTAKKFKPLLDMFISDERKETSGQWAKHFTDNDMARTSDVVSNMTDAPATVMSIQTVISSLQSDRYKAINFQNLYGNKKTIEFRIFEGSLDLPKIIERVKFAILFVNALNKSEIDLIAKIKNAAIKPGSLGARGRKTPGVKAAEEGMRELNHEQRTANIRSIQTFSTRKETVPMYFAFLKGLSDKAFDKPALLNGKNATVTIKDPQVLQRIRNIISDYDIPSITISGNKVTLSFVHEKQNYERAVKRILSSANLSAEGLEPKAFFDMMKDAEDKPFKRKFSKVAA